MTQTLGRYLDGVNYTNNWRFKNKEPILVRLAGAAGLLLKGL